MIKVLVSACLLGEPVRYNGEGCASKHDVLAHWQEEGRLISICPELAGGLTVPRPPAEIANTSAQEVIAGTGKVITREGEDLSLAFLQGAHAALNLALKHSVGLAILTEKSPSCGSQYTYDGSFTGTLRDGAGVTTALLEQRGIRVFSQHQLAEAKAYLDEVERSSLSSYEDLQAVRIIKSQE